MSYLCDFCSRSVGSRCVHNLEGVRVGGSCDGFAPTLQSVFGLRELHDRVPAILKRFRQAVLAAACSGRLTEEWRAASGMRPDATADLLERIRSEREQAKSRKKSRPQKLPSLPPFDEADIPDEWLWVTLDELLHYTSSAAYGVLQAGPHVPNVGTGLGAS